MKKLAGYSIGSWWVAVLPFIVALFSIYRTRRGFIIASYILLMINIIPSMAAMSIDR